MTINAARLASRDSDTGGHKSLPTPRAQRRGGIRSPKSPPGGMTVNRGALVRSLIPGRNRRECNLVVSEDNTFDLQTPGGEVVVDAALDDVSDTVRRHDPAEEISVHRHVVDREPTIARHGHTRVSEILRS